MDNPQITFSKTNNVEFFSVLRSRVDAYFKNNEISKYANRTMVMSTVIILTLHIATYVLILSDIFTPWVLFLLAALHGFLTAQIGLNIGHDAIHGTYSKKRKVNKRMSIIFNLVGANDYLWGLTHNLMHHTYTNIPNYDEDLNQPKVLRVSPEIKRKKIHRFQHYYAFALYSVASLMWVFVKDYITFFTPNLGRQGKKHEAKEYFRLFGYKFAYYTLFIIVPILVLDYQVFWILLGFLVSHIVEGLTLALIFHLAHLVEGTDFPEPDEKGSMENSWAVHQLFTTANFARKNVLANYICGGLNFQIEHHLFPQICHVHYWRISPIVKRTALDFGLPYNENKTFFQALGSHFRFLKKMGTSNTD